MPAPRRGSIETHSGYGAPLKDGSEIHRERQRAAKESDESYESEVSIAGVFERGDYAFHVEGRMDGIFRLEVPHIEEIKSTFNIWELSKALKDKYEDHPYVLQLLTYGYCFWKKEGLRPSLSFHLISTRNGESTDVDIQFHHKLYEAWLDRRLDELCHEALKAEKRLKRRETVATQFPFPFERPRPGQIELMEKIEESFKADRRLLIQAPTGLGKTAGVLYPSLKEALSRGQKVVYVTPKNSQHAVAEEAVERFQSNGSKIRSLTVTAKSKMCLKAEPLCDPEYCEYADGHYDKLSQHKVKSVLEKKKSFTAKVFTNLAKKFEVCPFELQLEAMDEADVVICDYNYVFGSNSFLDRGAELSMGKEGKPNLVIDEAHNLPARAMGYFSPSLSLSVLEKIGEDMTKLNKKFAQDGRSLARECGSLIKELSPKSSKTEEITLEIGPFLAMESELRLFLTRYLESDVEIKPQDAVLRLTFYWNEFTQVLRQVIESGRKEFFMTYQPDGTMRINCCDASTELRPKYDNFEHVVAFSATLKPFDYYARFMGLDEKTERAEFETPFLKENRKLLIIPQVSTKYSERSRNVARIADAMAKIIALKEGNYLAFFPSFEFMEQVFREFKAPASLRVLKQERKMKNVDVESVLTELKSERLPTLLFAVQGGVFSEGVDYPGEMVIGAFIIGPPLPLFEVEREWMRNYYEMNFKAGFDYAYVYPAMAKSIQAAGRVIRTEKDKGLIVLMDSRFLEETYAKTMPKDWFTDSPKELVSSKILNDVSDFWSSASGTFGS